MDFAHVANIYWGLWWCQLCARGGDIGMSCSRRWSQGVIRFWGGRHVSKEFIMASRELGGDRRSWSWKSGAQRKWSTQGQERSNWGRARGWVWSRSGNLPEGNEGREKGIQHRSEDRKQRKTFSRGTSRSRRRELEEDRVVRREKSFPSDRMVSVGRGRVIS